MNKFLNQSLLIVCCLASMVACQSRSASPGMVQRAPVQMQRNVRANNVRAQNTTTKSQRMFSLDELRGKIAEGVFARLDSNGNKRLEPNEASAYNVRDLNQSGAIELDEFVQQKENVLIERFSVAKMRAAFQSAFAKKDVDQNGFVSFQEDRNINMIFDYNGDQQYSYAEYEDAIAQVFTLVPSRMQEWVNAHFS